MPMSDDVAANIATVGAGCPEAAERRTYLSASRR
jgi:hypothetical protein